MFPVSSMMANRSRVVFTIVGEFSHDLRQVELFSFAPERSTDVTPLEVSVGSSWSPIPVGIVSFKILLPPLSAVGVADSGTSVLFSINSGVT